MCLPMINNKLLEICKGKPNNLEQQYWTCFVFVFFKAHKSKAKGVARVGRGGVLGCLWPPL